MNENRLVVPIDCAELAEAEVREAVGGMTLAGSVAARGIIVVCRTGWAAFEQSFVSIAPIPSP